MRWLAQLQPITDMRHDMNRRICLPLLLAALSLSACGGGSSNPCPEGLVPMEGRCVLAPDAGVVDGGGDGDVLDGEVTDGDAGSDGGPTTST